MTHMREQSQPRLMDRRVREEWEEGGRLGMYDRALTKARDLLENHHPEPLPDDVRQQVRDIVEREDRAAGRA